MNRLTIAALMATIATARAEREHASLAQLMMLHDEMVAKIEEPNNGNRRDEEVEVSVDVEVDKREGHKGKGLQPRYDDQKAPDEKYTRSKDPTRVDVPDKKDRDARRKPEPADKPSEGDEKTDKEAPELEQRFVDTRCPDLFEFIEKEDVTAIV